jgi:hypothetical protein
MDKVIVESPYKGDVALNKRYLRMVMLDCLRRNEAPFASHGLYTQVGVLDDDNPEDRELGISAGLLWGECADKTVVYTDLGVTAGMDEGISHAKECNREIEYRELVGWNSVNV